MNKACVLVLTDNKICLDACFDEASSFLREPNAIYNPHDKTVFTDETESDRERDALCKRYFSTAHDQQSDQSTVIAVPSIEDFSPQIASYCFVCRTCLYSNSW